jgi:hypothetical protein
MPLTSSRPNGRPAAPPPAPRPQRRWLVAFVLCSAIAAAAYGAYGLYKGTLVIPERFNPWAPLDVMAPPNFLTGYKLSRTRSDRTLCRGALSQTAMDYELLPDRVTGAGCGFDNAVLLRGAGVRIGAPLPLSCPMALSFFMWERHALQPAAQRYLGQRVTAISHLGSYACRNINRGEDAAPESNASPASRSRHATANALDIAGFTLENGRRITVLKDWRQADANSLPDRASLMLTDAHTGACRFFNGVLGPDYNAVHRDHFHLETGGYAMCR